jgi:hypothetical protein
MGRLVLRRFSPLGPKFPEYNAIDKGKKYREKRPP